MVELRVPTTDDAEAAARCQLACWGEAYADIAAPGRLAPLVAGVAERTARWREIVLAPSTVLLADDGGAVVGFASAGASRDDDASHAPDLELYALYVRRAHWDTGLGHRLITAVLGDAPASLWVFRDNERARGFYARHGFRASGEEKDQPSFGAPEIRMLRGARAAGDGR